MGGDIPLCLAWGVGFEITAVIIAEIIAVGCQVLKL